MPLCVDLVEVVVLAAGRTHFCTVTARERRRLLSGEVGLEHHPGHGEEQRRVVRDQRPDGWWLWARSTKSVNALRTSFAFIGWAAYS